MARVDENREAQRAAEQRALEKSAQKRSALEQRQSFSEALSKNQKKASEQAKATNRQQLRSADARARAANALLARQGIAANSFAAELQREGINRLDKNHGEAIARSEDLVSDRSRRTAEDDSRTEQARDDERQVTKNQDRLAAISRDDEGRGSGGGSQDGMGSGSFSSGTNSSDDSMGAGLEADAAGLRGEAVGAAEAQQAQGALAEQPKLQQLIATLVKHVMTGVDKKGLGVMHVELKDDVLGGAKMLITAGEGGVSLKIDTRDESARRLLASGQTAHELTQALSSKGIRLNGLEVNGEKVVR